MILTNLSQGHRAGTIAMGFGCCRRRRRRVFGGALDLRVGGFGGQVRLFASADQLTNGLFGTNHHGLAEHAQRKTVTTMDVVYALKKQGRTLYGFGG